MVQSTHDVPGLYASFSAWTSGNSLHILAVIALVSYTDNLEKQKELPRTVCNGAGPIQVTPRGGQEFVY